MPELTNEVRIATLTEQQTYARDILLHLDNQQLGVLKRLWQIDRPASTLTQVGLTTIQKCGEACLAVGVQLTRVGVGVFKTSHGIGNAGEFEGIIGAQTADALFNLLANSGATAATNHVIGALFQRVQSNKQTYIEAGQTAKVPWRILAAIHYRENGCKAASPGPGGAFQMDPPLSDARLGLILQKYGLPFKRVESDFFTAAVVAGDHLQSKVNFRLEIATTSSALLKDALWGYNGRSYGAADDSPYVSNDPPRRILRIRGTVIRPNGTRQRVDRADPRPGAWIIYREILQKFP